MAVWYDRAVHIFHVNGMTNVHDMNCILQKYERHSLWIHIAGMKLTEMNSILYWYEIHTTLCTYAASKRIHFPVYTILSECVQSFYNREYANRLPYFL